jgi:hypothetical protein
MPTPHKRLDALRNIALQNNRERHKPLSGGVPKAAAAQAPAQVHWGDLNIDNFIYQSKGLPPLNANARHMGRGCPTKLTTRGYGISYGA